jgi:FecR protein
MPSLLSTSLRQNLRLLVCVMGLGLSSAVWAQLPAAKVMSVTGTVKAIDPQGRERLLEKGFEVRSGEKIITGDGALVQMRLNDGGFLSVRAGSEMVIDRFVYDEKNASNSNFLVSLVRGGFRSITGLIGKTNPDAYQIRTTTATVGIRGTDHEPMVIPEGVPGMAALGAPGFYDKVNDGETFIRNRNGMLTLKRGDVGFAPAIADRAPAILLKIPDFYKVELKTDARETTTLTSPISTTILAPVSSTLLTIEPMLLSPTTTLIAPTTTLLAPISSTTLTTTSATLLSPTTTLIAPTTTLIAPITTTTILPTTTLIAPTTTYIAPTTTYITPTTTIKSTILLK